MEAQFSWRKILSFFGAGLLAFVAIVTVAAGIGMCVGREAFYGVITILSGISTGAWVVYLYKDYERWSAANNNQKPNYTR
jgi:uncharacterized membrane-anchored protein